MKSKGIRIGILGAGSIVQKVHLPILCQHSDIEFIGLADLYLDRAVEMSQSITLPHKVMKIEELFAARDIDVILIATPNYFHAAQVKKALKKGKHVICEKPLSLYPKTCEDISGLALSANRSVFIGYVNRFRPDIQFLKELLRLGLLGSIRYIKVGWNRKNGIPGLNGWHTNSKYSGGGALADIGIHLLDLLNDLLHEEYGSTTWYIKSNIFNFTMDDMSANADWYEDPKELDITPVTVEKGVEASIRTKDFYIDFETHWNKVDNISDETYLSVDCEEALIEVNTLFGLSPNGTRSTTPLRIYFKKNGSIFQPEFPNLDDPLLPYKLQWNSFLKKLKSGCIEIDMLLNEKRNAILLEGIYRSAKKGKRTSIRYP